MQSGPIIFEKIDVMMTRMGGGFGRRIYGRFGVEAAVISQKMQAPIKLVYTREDDMTQGTYRPSYKVCYKAGLDEEGNLIAWHVRGVGTNDDLIFENRFPAGAVDNYLAEKHSLETIGKAIFPIHSYLQKPYPLYIT